MTTKPVVWGGEKRELVELEAAISRNCACVQGAQTCSAHALLLDQRVLDHLAYVKRLVGRLRRGEFSR